MNLRDARKELLCATAAGNAVLMVSSSGIGKSQLQLAVFSEIKARDAARGLRWGLGTVFAATQTPPDLIGYQFKGERDFAVKLGVDNTGKDVIKTSRVTVTDPSVPLWMISVPHGDDPGGMPAFMYDRFYLIIEEYGQGEADVKRAMAEIFLNGGTAPWYLPAGSIRVASSNSGQRYGVTKDFDFCISRRTQININGDVDVWLEDFADKPYVYQGRVWQTLPVVKAWAKQNPQVLFEEEPKEQGPWCNPRTLCAFDRYLQAKMEINGDTVIPQDPITQEHGAGTIGMPAMQSLDQHLTFRLQLPAYDDVIKDPTGTPVPQKADMQMLMAYEMANNVQTQHLTECLTYIQRIPAKDMHVTFVLALLRRDYRNVINSPAMQGWINKNAALLSIIQSLATH
jgi:hypothetical protein